MGTVRAVTKEDLAMVALLDGVLFPENSFTDTLLEREMDHPGRELLVVNEQVHAYALLALKGGYLDILRLGVDPHFRRRGYGTLLLRHAKRQGYPMVLTVRKDNVAAKALYFREGFRIYGTDATDGAWVLRAPSA